MTPNLQDTMNILVLFRTGSTATFGIDIKYSSGILNIIHGHLIHFCGYQREAIETIISNPY